MRLFALDERGRSESVVAAMHQLLQQRVLRVFRLDQHFAGFLGATCTSRYLHDRLRKSFGRAEVRAEQTLVGVQHDYQRDQRKVVALGQHLRADQQAHLAAVNTLDHFLERAALAHGIAVDAGQREFGKEIGQRLLDALRALSHGLDHCAAIGADLGDRAMRAAVVAIERTFALMHGQSRVAAWTRCDPAAAGAEQRRCVATAVQIDQHLAASVEVTADGQQRRRRKALRVCMSAQVNQVQARRPGACRSVGQVEALRAAGADALEAFERRCRRAQHDGDAVTLSPGQCQVARGIAEALLLLVRSVVLFVDHDQPGAGERREDGRTCADDHRRRAGASRAPRLQAIGVGEPRMHHRERPGESRREARDELRRQRDLRHQDQRLLAACDHVGNRAQVHLGLAAAGHAVQHERRKAPVCCHDRADRCILFGRQFGPRFARDGVRHGSAIATSSRTRITQPRCSSSRTSSRHRFDSAPSSAAPAGPCPAR